MRKAIEASHYAGIRHFNYVSVAQPAPVMKEYIAARSEAERLLRQTGMDVTILRPWYIVGPGHRTAYFLIPIYAVLDCIHATAKTSRRPGLVTLGQMLGAMVYAVEHPGNRILEVPEIRTYERRPI